MNRYNLLQASIAATAHQLECQPEMATRRLVFFHAPCFDGLVSAAIAADFLEHARGWRPITLRGVGYESKPTWLRRKPSRPFAVVDFLFHPDAAFWADHHSTTFLTPALRHRFERRRRETIFYDPAARSCAALIWRQLKKTFGYRVERFRHMVEWASIIDSAAYRSVDEVFESSAPALVINLALSQFTVREAETVARRLRVADLAEVADLPLVRLHVKTARNLAEKGLRRFQRKARLEGDIVVFDVDARNSLVNRYAPYRFFPDARYSAGIVRHEDGVKITAMRNPWRAFPSVPLGRIFEEVGGGGHRRVASVVLKPPAARRARAVLERVVSRIRQRDIAASRST